MLMVMLGPQQVWCASKEIVGEQILTNLNAITVRALIRVFRNKFVNYFYLAYDKRYNGIHCINPPLGYYCFQTNSTIGCFCSDVNDSECNINNYSPFKKN